MVYTKEYLEKKYKKIKNVANGFLLKENYEKAIAMYSFAARYMYSLNFQYADDEIEERIENISKDVINISGITHEVEGRVVFYDSYGYDTRGIANIYLKSLIKMGYMITYVTTQEAEGKIPTIEKILSTREQNEIQYVNDLQSINGIKSVEQILKKNSISFLFLYLMPWDLTGISIGNALKDLVPRVMINLVDHGFWLGKNCFDKLLEFREYGVRVSLQKRNIEEEKVFYLPYYPNIQKEVEFQGWGRDLSDKKVVFSGGSLYKTYGKNNIYYKLIQRILMMGEDIVFIYAGEGDTTELVKLQKKFPNRVLMFKERKDLYEMMRHCRIYISTYPMIGGLMSQYAAAAGRPPYTLLYDEGSSGVLLDSERAQIEYENEDEMLEQIRKVLYSDSACKEAYARMENQILKEEEFDQALFEIMMNDEHVFKTKNRGPLDTKKFQKTYLERLSRKNYFKLYGKKERRYWIVARYFPVEFFLGCFYGVIERIRGE